MEHEVGNISDIRSDIVRIGLMLDVLVLCAATRDSILLSGSAEKVCSEFLKKDGVSEYHHVARAALVHIDDVIDRIHGQKGSGALKPRKTKKRKKNA